jgi:hypothetical protein
VETRKRRKSETGWQNNSQTSLRGKPKVAL